MMIVKLALAAVILFSLFAAVLLFSHQRKAKGGEKCSESGEHRCHSCRCERF